MGWYRAMGPLIRAAVDRAKRENPEAFKKLLRSHRSKVYVAARQTLNLQDLVQLQVGLP